MRALLAIVGREVGLRASVLPLALLLGCVPVALDVSVPGFVASVAFAGMSRGLLAVAILVSVTALFTGWSMIAPDQSAGHLGFLFSRPLSWWSIWGGKLAAAVGLPLAAGVFAVLPSLAAYSGRWRAFWSTPQVWVELVGAGTLVLLLVGLGNAVSVGWSSRPLQRAMDLALLAGFLIVLLRPSFLLTVATWSFGYAHQGALGPVPVALAALVASAAQAGVGRTDPRRSHAAFTSTLWPLLYFAMAAIAGVGYLMAESPPSRLRRVERAEGAPRGGWIFVSGPVRWGQYEAAFLYEPASGRYISLGSGRHVSGLSFSLDGSLAAVVEKDPLVPYAGRTRVVRLGELPVAQTVFAHVTLDVALSRDYLAALDYSSGRQPGPAPGWGHSLSGGLDLYRLPAGKRVKSIPTSDAHHYTGSAWRSPLAFRQDGRLRIGLEREGYPNRPRIDLYLVDPDRTDLLRESDEHGRYRALGTLNLEPYGSVSTRMWEAVELRSNESGDRVLMQRSSTAVTYSPEEWKAAGFPPGWRICLHETSSGDHLRTLFAGPGAADADFLSDGLRAASGSQAGIAVADVRDGHGSLRLLAVDGRELAPSPWREDLSPAFSVSLAGEPAPGYLVLGVRRSATDFGYTFVLGPSGSWREPGIYPVAPRAETQDSPGAGRPAAGSLGSRLFISEDGTLVRYDPETRARTVLLGRAGG